MRNFFFIIILLFVFCIGCQPEKKKAPAPQQRTAELLIADTIIYDVIVRNTNPEDTWTSETLRQLKLDTLLNALFQTIYERKAKVYDYFTEEYIRPRKLKKMEENGVFSRDELGKIQFTEVWFYNRDSLNLRKEVLSMVIGQELYDLDGNVRGYKPVFKINLNPPAQ